MMARPRLLAISTIPAWPITEGQSLRTANLLRELAKTWSIRLIAPPQTVVPDGLADSITLVPVTLDNGRCLYPWRFSPAPLLAALDRELAEHRPERMLVWPGAETVGFSNRVLPRAVMDITDCVALEFWRGFLAHPGLRQKLRNLREVPVALRTARRMVRGFPVITAVGEDDARWLANAGGRHNVAVVPNGVDIPDAASLPAPSPTPLLSFHGSLDYGPNIVAVLHAARAIWPIVREAVPEARFSISGRNPAPELVALHGQDGIAIEADPIDINAVMGRAWVSTASMCSGVGIKNKVLEAWACGIPVVMSPLATNGLIIPPEHAFLVSRDPQVMAERIITLLRSDTQRRALGVQAREHVARHFTWAGAAARISDLLG